MYSMYRKNHQRFETHIILLHVWQKMTGERNQLMGLTEAARLYKIILKKPTRWSRRSSNGSSRYAKQAGWYLPLTSLNLSSRSLWKVGWSRLSRGELKVWASLEMLIPRAPNQTQQNKSQSILTHFIWQKLQTFCRDHRTKLLSRHVRDPCRDQRTWNLRQHDLNICVHGEKVFVEKLSK